MIFLRLCEKTLFAASSAEQLNAPLVLKMKIS